MPKIEDEEEAVEADTGKQKAARMLGWIKRKDPLLYDKIIEETEAGKKSIADVVFDALRTKYLFMQTEAMNLSSAQLLGAFEFWNQVMSKSISVVMDMFKFFYTRGLESYISILEVAKEKLSETPAQEKKPEMPIELKTMLAQSLINVFSNFLGNMPNIMPNLASIMQSAVKQQQQQQDEVKIIEEQ